MGNIKFSELTEKTAPHKDDLLVISDMENNISKKVKYGTIRPYKVYVALLTQAGTDAPVATVLENTLGGTVVWTRVEAGVYKGTLASAFTTNKVFPNMRRMIIKDVSLNDIEINLLTSMSQDYILLGSAEIDTGNGVDSLIKLLPIEIRVYY